MGGVGRPLCEVTACKFKRLGLLSIDLLGAAVAARVLADDDDDGRADRETMNLDKPSMSSSSSTLKL
jgi:hypothetical protein